jgi:uncharacterized protein RhaS with RHS repeats
VTHTYPDADIYTAAVTASNNVSVLTATTVVTITSPPAYDFLTRTITYTYDGLYRLVEADYSTGEQFEYAYDAVGNRETYTATITNTVVTTYAYDAANRLVNAGGVAYTWSDAGRLLADGAYTYTWDAAGRLITVTDGIPLRFAPGTIAATLGFR